MMLLQKPALIVSCQARDDNPLTGPHFMQAMALAAIQGGAHGIRANGIDDIAAIRAITKLPIIGLLKKDLEHFAVYITPDLPSIEAVANAGADMIALDATHQNRPVTLEVLFQEIHALGKLVFADCATLQDALRAEQLGANYISTTMAGYTPETLGRKTNGPDFEVLGQIVEAVNIPVVAEGRFWTPEQMQQAFVLGATGVVVGTAITNPRDITKHFAAGLTRK